MTGAGASAMTCRPSRGQREASIPPVGDPAYDALLARTLPPEDAPEPGCARGGAFAALHAAPVTSGMAAEAQRPARRSAARSAGLLNPPAHPVGAAPCSHPCSAPSWPRPPRPPRSPSAAPPPQRTPAPCPPPSQKFAHDTIGAPSAHHSASRHPGRPAADRQPGSAYGLCTAYTHMKAHGTAAQKAAAFRNLAAAAGGPQTSRRSARRWPTPEPRRPASRLPIAPASRPLTLRASRPAFPPASRPPTPRASRPAFRLVARAAIPPGSRPPSPPPNRPGRAAPSDRLFPQRSVATRVPAPRRPGLV